MIESGHAARPAHRHGHARDDRGARSRGRHPRARDHGRRRRCAALERELAWRAPRPLAGRTRGRHACARAGKRARASGSRALGRERRAGARDPSSRACPAPPLDPSRYDLVCLTSANGVEVLFERLAAGGAMRARSRARAWRRSGRAPRGRWPSTASRADVVPERSVAEGLVEALAGVPRQARADRACARARATCCPTRCARAARRSTCSSLYETRRRAARAANARSARARRLHHLHVRLDGALLPRRARRVRRGRWALAADAHRLDRPGHERRAARARPRAARGGRAATTSTASSRRCSPTPLAGGLKRRAQMRAQSEAAHQLPLRLRPRRRVRGRLPRRDRPALPGRARDRHHPRDPPPRRAHGRAGAARRARLPARQASTWRSSTDRGRRRGCTRGGPSRCAPPSRIACSWAPTTGC